MKLLLPFDQMKMYIYGEELNRSRYFEQDEKFNCDF